MGEVFGGVQADRDEEQDAEERKVFVYPTHIRGSCGGLQLTPVTRGVNTDVGAHWLFPRDVTRPYRPIQRPFQCRYQRIIRTWHELNLLVPGTLSPLAWCFVLGELAPLLVMCVTFLFS